MLDMGQAHHLLLHLLLHHLQPRFRSLFQIFQLPFHTFVLVLRRRPRLEGRGHLDLPELGLHHRLSPGKAEQRIHQLCRLLLLLFRQSKKRERANKSRRKLLLR